MSFYQYLKQLLKFKGIWTKHWPWEKSILISLSFGDDFCMNVEHTEYFYFFGAGQGTITQIRENKRESSNVRPGDIIRIQAGTPVYMINRDDNEKLFVAKLLQPVSTPGQYEVSFFFFFLIFWVLCIEKDKINFLSKLQNLYDLKLTCNSINWLLYTY